METILKKAAAFIKTPGFKFTVKALICVICLGISCWSVNFFTVNGISNNSAKNQNATNYVVMDRYEKYIINSFSDALEGVMSIKKVYWLSDDDMIAPKPNPSCFGQTSNPKDMQAILDQAKDLIDGQEMVFSTDVELIPGSVIRYYYDPTILAINWQVRIDGTAFTISEVKIADASQFRRFLSDGEYSSGGKYLTSEMANTVNAVTASSGDYYSFRWFSNVVYNGQLFRYDGRYIDCCYVDANGDLQFLRAGEITSEEEMQKYIEQNNIRFSLCFGPILVDNGQPERFLGSYPVGEVEKPNERAALCQKDKLHYLMVCANPNPNFLVLWKFRSHLVDMGVQKAYNLDGGRTGAIVFNGQRINNVEERLLSDIIYFATAINYEDEE